MRPISSRRQRQQKHIADLDLVTGQFLRVDERKLAQRVLDLLDNCFLGRDLDLAFLVVPVDLDAVACLVLELLASGGPDGVLHRLDDHVAVEALLIAQDLYTLSDR